MMSVLDTALRAYTPELQADPATMLDQLGRLPERRCMAHRNWHQQSSRFGLFRK